MSDFLIRSLILSVVLTVALNLFLAWRSRQASRSDVDGASAPSPFPESSPFEPPPDAATGDRPRVQVYFPWKAMLIGSIALTILLNLGALIGR